MIIMNDQEFLHQLVRLARTSPKTATQVTAAGGVSINYAITRILTDIVLRVGQDLKKEYPKGIGGFKRPTTSIIKTEVWMLGAISPGSMGPSKGEVYLSCVFGGSPYLYVRIDNTWDGGRDYESTHSFLRTQTPKEAASGISDALKRQLADWVQKESRNHALSQDLERRQSL